jgi:hypothetical protein
MSDQSKSVKGVEKLMLKRTVVALLISVLVAGWSFPAAAAESSVKVIFEDAFYGGVVGCLLGAATIVFTHNRSEHLGNIAYGGAVGVFAGTGFGVYKSTTSSLVEIDNGKVKFAMPTVMPEIVEKGNGQLVLAVRAGLLRGSF